MNLFPREENFVFNILKINLHDHVISKHPKSVHISGRFKFTDQGFITKNKDRALSWAFQVAST